jgi:hypothetical protein
MPGADTRKTEAVERLVDLAGLSKSEAESVVDAAVRGAEDQAFETIVGAGPLPSSLAAFRAQQLHYACLNASGSFPNVRLRSCSGRPRRRREPS